MNKCILKRTTKTIKIKRVKKQGAKSNGPGLTLSYGKKVVFVLAAEVVSNDDLARLLAQAKKSAKPIRVEFRSLANWPAEFRWDVLQQLVSLDVKIAIVPGKNKEPAANLFDALLSLISQHDDIAKSGAIREACCEAAAICHPRHIEEAVTKICRAYKAADKEPPTKSDLKRCIKNLTGAANRRVGSDGERLANDFLKSLAKTDAADCDLEIPWLAYYRQDWFIYEGRLWQRKSDPDIHAAIARHAQHINDGNLAITERLIRDTIVNLKGLCAQFDSSRQMPLWLSDNGTCKASPFIACQNGLLKMGKVLRCKKPPKLFKFTPRHFSTVQLGFAYDPKALCPTWLEALNKFLAPTGPGDKRIAVLQELFGWTFCESGLRLEACLIMFGDGGNGKSQILTVLRHLLGPANVSALAIEHLGDDHRLAEVDGKLANITNDMNRVDAFAEGILKQIVSGEPVQINPKYKASVTVELYAKFIFATNHLPQIGDRTCGVFRRLVTMPFLERVDGKGRIRGYAETHLLPELSGIANWAIEGLIRLAEQGDLTRCTVCQHALDDHREHSDPFLQFIDEECSLNTKHSVARPFLYQKYKTWCEKNGRRPVNSAEIYSRVEKLKGVEKTRPGTNGKRPRIYRGIGINAEYHTVDD